MYKRIEVWILTVIFGQFLILFALFSVSSGIKSYNPPENVEIKLPDGNKDEHFPSVVFLKINENKTDIWRTDINGENTIQLTRNGEVYDFSVSRDGEKIIYSAFNDQNGLDIWEIDKIGQTEKKLVGCGKNWCAQPALSPDSRYIAYSQKPGEGALAESKINIYDYQENRIFPLEVLYSIKSTAPAWSFDGDRLSYFDPENNFIHVMDFLGGQEDINIKTTFPEAVSWSRKGGIFYWVEPRATVQGVVYNFVYVTDIETGIQRQVLGQHDQAEFGIPEESPDGQWITYSVRFLNGSPYRYLHIKNLLTGVEEAIVQDLNYYYGGYHWDPSSKMMILQRIKTNSSQAKPEIIIWWMKTNSVTLLAENASRPQWLP
jgi:hypothetical protein